MQMNTQLESVSKVRPWLGAIITGLVVLFLAFDGVTKILQLTPVVKASEKLGIAADLLLGIGVLLLTCTVIYLIPKTTILGAILLTGYHRSRRVRWQAQVPRLPRCQRWCRGLWQRGAWQNSSWQACSREPVSWRSL